MGASRNHFFCLLFGIEEFHQLSPVHGINVVSCLNCLELAAWQGSPELSGTEQIRGWLGRSDFRTAHHVHEADQSSSPGGPVRNIRLAHTVLRPPMTPEKDIKIHKSDITPFYVH